MSQKEEKLTKKSTINVKKLKGTRENPFKEVLLKEVQDHKKTRIQYIKNGKNNTKTGAELVIADPDSGEVIGGQRFYVRKEYDDAQFTKIMTDKISHFFDMDKQATRVFAYISSVLRPNKDFFYLDMYEAMEFTEYQSESSIWKGMRWLVANEFIAKSDQTNKYFINPTVFANGNRITIAETYINVEAERKAMEEGIKGVNNDNLLSF